MIYVSLVFLPLIVSVHLALMVRGERHYLGEAPGALGALFSVMSAGVGVAFTAMAFPPVSEGVEMLGALSLGLLAAHLFLYFIVFERRER